jgi:signal transduction histidine kinase
MRNQLFVLPLLEHIEARYQHDEELRALAQIARQTHDRLNELIDDVRTFARKDDATHRRIPVNLTTVVREAVSLAGLHPSVPKHALKLDVRAEPVVTCHAVRIQQVIFNLVRNAADAVRGHAQPQITVTVEDDGDHATLSVRDNGPGIAAAHRERLGQPFFTTKGEAGTGLGLDICQRIVTAHGGTITFESPPGQGATFSIRLPKYR